MKTASISDAKAHLNELVALAEKGEDVVLMRGSKIVACIKPASEGDYKATNDITDEQAERFWQQILEERQAGRGMVFESAAAAAEYIRNWKPKA